MINDVIFPHADVKPYSIVVEQVAETKYVTTANTLTNGQALNKIAEYLDAATEYLRKQRLQMQS